MSEPSSADRAADLKGERDTLSVTAVDDAGVADRGQVFPHAVVDASEASDAEGEKESIASFGAEMVGAVERIGLSAEEMVAVPLADRVAVLLDAPRSELLRDMASRVSRAPEDIIIEALDRLFDDAV